MLKNLWHDDHGGVISPEIAVVGAILVIGIIVGLTALRTAINSEIQDIGHAVESIDFTPTVTPVPPSNTNPGNNGNGGNSGNGSPFDPSAGAPFGPPFTPPGPPPTIPPGPPDGRPPNS